MNRFTWKYTDLVFNGEVSLEKQDIPLSTKAIITDKLGRVLIMRDSGDNPWWDLPGGHVDSAESPEEALRREVKEETGLEVEDIKELDISGDTRIGRDNHPVLFYRASAKGELELSPEHEKLAWVTADNVDKYNLGNFRDVIADFLGIDIEKSKVAYHEHDGFTEHPVAVKHHQEYFADGIDTVEKPIPERPNISLRDSSIGSKDFLSPAETSPSHTPVYGVIRKELVGKPFDVNQELKLLDTTILTARRVFSDPKNRKLIELEFGEDASHVLYNARSTNRPGGVNIIFTNEKKDVGMGSSTTGREGLKVFWHPYTLGGQDETVTELGIDPMRTVIHEWTHTLGSDVEFDDLSETVAASIHLKNGNIWNPKQVQYHIGKLISVAVSSRMPAKSRKRAILNLAFLEREVPNSLKPYLDDYVGETTSNIWLNAIQRGTKPEQEEIDAVIQEEQHKEDLRQAATMPFDIFWGRVSNLDRHEAQQEHKRLLEAAQKEGIDISPSVLGEYPELRKAQPPRAGLVPKTGDGEHPGRWIRPKETDGEVQSDSIDVVIGQAPHKTKAEEEILEEILEKNADGPPDAYSADYYTWIDSNLKELEKAGVVIGGNPPGGAKKVGKQVELRLYSSLREAVEDFLHTLKGTETQTEVLQDLKEIIEKWGETNLVTTESAFESLFKRGFMAGAVSAGLSGKMGVNDENAMEVLKHGKYRIGERIKLFGDEAIKDFSSIIKEAYTPTGVFDLDDMVKRMREAVPAERFKLERIARTETAIISSTGRLWAWEQSPDREYFTYRWSSVPDSRRKKISEIRSGYGDLSYEEAKFLWLNQEQYIPELKKFENDTFNQRCVLVRYPSDKKVTGNRFHGQEHLFRKTIDTNW